jgi:hypothetical protein
MMPIPYIVGFQVENGGAELNSGFNVWVIVVYSYRPVRGTRIRVIYIAT